MKPAEIKEIQRKIGVEDDGFWGPVSMAAVNAYLRSLARVPNRWPKPDVASMTRFYGARGEDRNLARIECPIPMYYEGRKIEEFSVHLKCAESICIVLKEAYEVAPLFVTVYDGCFNDRSMRGGSAPSIHAWGAAIDLHSEGNGNSVHWPVAATMPFAVMEAFAREGWVSLGARIGRDAMHFQATQ